MARTARQRAALRKAQLASARKRRGKGKGKLASANRRNTRNKRIAIGAAVVAGAAVGLAGYKAGKNGIVEGGRYRGKRGITVNRKHRSVVVRTGKRYGAAAFPKKKKVRYSTPAVRRTKTSYGRLPNESRFGTVKTTYVRGFEYRNRAGSNGVVFKRLGKLPRA